jgi:hypothetical protein
MTQWPEVENNIPIPEMRSSTTNCYRFGEMEIGQSVFFEGSTEACKKHNAAAHALGTLKRKKLKDEHGNEAGGYLWKFSTRMVEGGIRIWRIS